MTLERLKVVLPKIKDATISASYIDSMLTIVEKRGMDSCLTNAYYEMRTMECYYKSLLKDTSLGLNEDHRKIILEKMTNLKMRNYCTPKVETPKDKYPIDTTNKGVKKDEPEATKVEPIAPHPNDTKATDTRETTKPGIKKVIPPKVTAHKEDKYAARVNKLKAELDKLVKENPTSANSIMNLKNEAHGQHVLWRQGDIDNQTFEKELQELEAKKNKYSYK